MPATLDSILMSAGKEWKHWGRSTWDVDSDTADIKHRDDDRVFAQYVIDKYCSVGGGTPSLNAIQNDEYFWSAVGMSAIMNGAGFKAKEFPFSQRHSKFIRHFVAARKAGVQAAAYWGFRLDEPGGEPEPGDLVAYARGDGMTQEKANKLFDAARSYESHTDVVVAKSGNRIEVIGCNVLDSVTRKTLSLGPNGHILDSKHFWFAVLKRRDV